MGWRQRHAPPSTSRLSRSGGSLDGQSGDRYYGVYVPTRFGGVLQIKTTSGNIVELKRPNGTPLVNGQDIGFDQQGWYTFKVEGAKKPYSVENTFVQVGESTKKPWNFYYWPTKGDSIHEPWAGGNARVDTMNVPPVATISSLLARRVHSAGNRHRPARPQRAARNAPSARRRRHLVSQYLR